MTTQINSVKTFNTRLNAAVKSAGTLRDNVQELVCFGALHYIEHADPVHLTSLINKLVAVKGVNTLVLQQYIESHLNVKFTPGKKDAKPAFRHQKGTDSKATDTAIFDETKWYLHSAAGQAKAEFKSDLYAKRVAMKLIGEGVDLAEFAKLLKTAEKTAKENGAKQKEKTPTAEATGAR